MGRIFKLGIGIVAVLLTIAAQAATDLGGYSAPGKDTRPVTLLRGDFSPANSAITITRSGVYRLTGNMTGSGTGDLITITANDVELDLDGSTLANAARGIVVTGDRVTIINGSIDTMSTAGLVVSGSTCVVNNLEITNATKGIVLSSSIQGSFKNCRVLNATSMGIELVSSSTNSFVGCEILGVATTTAHAYGMYAHGGCTANTFEKCSIKGVRAVTNDAEGILFEDVDQSYITGCVVTDVVSTGSKARGINLDSNCVNCSLIGNTVKYINALAGTVDTDAIGFNVQCDFIDAGGNLASKNYLSDNLSGPINCGQGGTLIPGQYYSAYVSGSAGVNPLLIKYETDINRAGFNIWVQSPSANSHASPVDPQQEQLNEIQSTVEQVSSDLDECCVTTNSKLDVLKDVMLENFALVDADLANIHDDLQMLTASSLDSFVSNFEQLISLSDDLLVTMSSISEIAIHVEESLSNLEEIMSAVSVVDAEIGTLDSKLDACCFTMGSKLDVIDDKIDIIDTEVGVIDGKVDVIDTEVGVIDTKIGQLGTSIGDVLIDTSIIDSKLDVIDTEIGALTAAVGVIDTEVGVINGKVDVIDDKIDLLGGSINDVLISNSIIESTLENLSLDLTPVENDLVTVNSKLDVIDTEVGVINDTVNIIDDKVDLLGTSIGDVLVDTSIIDSKVDVIDTEVGALTVAVGVIDTEVGVINGKVDVIDDKVDLLGTSIGDVLVETSVIESILENLNLDLTPVLNDLVTVNSKLDVIDTEVGVINDTVNIIDDKVDLLGTSIGDVLVDTSIIDSKLDVIGTEVGVINDTVNIIDDKVDLLGGSIGDVLVDTIAIESKVDLLLADGACDATSLTSANVVGGAITLSTAGNYCLSENLTSTIYITADNVSLCLNNRELTGCINVTGKDALIKDGRIAVPSSLNSTSALSLVAGADSAVISNIIAVVESGAGARGDALSIAAHDAVVENSIFKGGVSSASSGGNGVSCSACTRATIRSSLCSGGSGTSSDGAGVSIVSGASLVTITNCTLESNEGNGATIGGSAIDVLDSLITASTLNASYCVSCVSPAARVHILNCRLDGKDAQLQSGTGDGINVASGCSGIEVRDCTIFGCADMAITDDHNATVANYSSVMYNNFAYDIAGATKYQVRNKGSMGESYGVDLVSGTPGLYSNVYVP